VGLRLNAAPPLRYASLRHGTLAAPQETVTGELERNQSKKKIHGAKKHHHNLTPAKPSAAKPLKVVMRSVF
jgi:hypothetical protein